MQSEALNDLAGQFREFYRSYYHGEAASDPRIDNLAQRYPKEQQSLRIDYDDLYQFDSGLAMDLLDQPDTVLDAAELALREYDLPGTVELSEARVRIGNLDTIEEPEDVTGSTVFDVGGYPADPDLGLVIVRGQVNKVAQSRGRVTNAAFECTRCGTINEVPQDGSDLQKPVECIGCERQGPFRMDWSQSTHEDYQLIRVQRPPEKSRSGARADTIDIELTDDLTGTVSAGDRVNAAVQLVPELDDQDKSTYSLYGDANSVEAQEMDYDDLEFDQHIDEIEAIANDRPFQKIINSIKPSHKGHEEIKEAIALQMFGGVKKELPDGGTIRGNSHILLVGDPGVDKSGLLSYARDITPRSVYTSGKNASAAGLTCAAVQTDFGDGGWTLEAGALVQAHKGLCAIDELDKIDDEDRAGVQEALANGTISPSKAGITNVSLPAETTVLSAANPEYGRFQQYEPIGEQIDLDPTLISRFDLIFTMQDSPNATKDRELAEHLNAAARAGERAAAGKPLEGSEAEKIKPEIEPEVMQHYVAYAKQTVSPELTDEAEELIADMYVDIRTKGADEDSPVPVTARKIEALHRLAEASARIRLSERVERQDAERAIRLVKSCLQDVGVDPETGQFDADVVETGESKAQRDRKKEIKEVVEELEYEYEDGAPVEKVVEEMISRGYENKTVRDDIETISTKGDFYYPRDEHIRLT